MNYLIVENGVIANVIVADPDFAAKIGAVPYYDGAAIGDPYTPPKVFTDAQLMEQRITDLHLSAIAQGQKQTELELALLQQGQYMTQKELEGLSNV